MASFILPPCKAVPCETWPVVLEGTLPSLTLLLRPRRLDGRCTWLWGRREPSCGPTHSCFLSCISVANQMRNFAPSYLLYCCWEFTSGILFSSNSTLLFYMNKVILVYCIHLKNTNEKEKWRSHIPCHSHFSYVLPGLVGYLTVHLFVCLFIFKLFPPPPSPEDACVLTLCKTGIWLYMGIYFCFSLHH